MASYRNAGSDGIDDRLYLLFAHAAIDGNTTALALDYYLWLDHWQALHKFSI